MCAAGRLGLASGEPASQVRKQKRSRSCAGECSARTHCGQHERRLHDTPAACAAVAPCGGVLVSSTPATVGGGGAGAPAVGYSMYSQWGTLVYSPTVSTHTYSPGYCEYWHLRHAAVCSRHSEPRPSAAAVPAHLRFGYSEYSQLGTRRAPKGTVSTHTYSQWVL